MRRFMAVVVSSAFRNSLIDYNSSPRMIFRLAYQMQIIQHCREYFSTAQHINSIPPPPKRKTLKMGTPKSEIGMGREIPGNSGFCRSSKESLGPGNSGKFILGTPFLAIWGDFLGELIGNGRNTVSKYCFGRENSLSSAANSVSSAKNSASSLLHTNNRLKGTH